jgi:hypothetical protein
MLTKYANLLLELPPVYLQTSEDVSKEANKMDASLDVNRFTNENKTGRWEGTKREGESERGIGERRGRLHFYSNHIGEMM